MQNPQAYSQLDNFQFEVENFTSAFGFDTDCASQGLGEANQDNNIPKLGTGGVGPEIEQVVTEP